MSKKRSSPSKYVDPFRVSGGGTFHLRDHITDADGGLQKAAGNKIIEDNRTRLQDLQERLYAQDNWSLLLIFQGMDAAGKDSAIKSVFDGINPQGCDVTPFKSPSTLELDHDYMWRSNVALPQRGHIGIFNRSYYEECLVVRVHPEMLAKQKIPKELVGKNIWRERFEDIRAFERYLTRNGTVVLKFFLNVSKEEQRKRFLDRLEEPAKNWKFSMADISERELWDKYQNAYEEMIDNTATEGAPWHIVPADRKWFARVVIGSTIVNALSDLDLQFPKADAASAKEFKLVREALEQEGAKPEVVRIAPPAQLIAIAAAAKAANGAGKAEVAGKVPKPRSEAARAKSDAAKAAAEEAAPAAETAPEQAAKPVETDE